MRDKIETRDEIAERGVSDERREERGGRERKGHCNMQRIGNHTFVGFRKLTSKSQENKSYF